MKITILANRDVASCLAVNYLVRGLPQDRLTLFLSSRVGSKPLASPLQHLKFVEQDLFNRLLFPLLPRGLEQQGELLGFDQLGELLAGRLTDLNDINLPSGLAVFAGSEPELVLSIRYGHILKEDALGVPEHGVLNLHSGRLPDYKGVMATFWALLNGEPTIGTTLHYIDDRSIDTGRIVATTSLPVNRDRSYLWHVLSLYRDGCKEMVSAVNTIRSRGATPATEQGTGGNYFTFPTEAHLREFTAQGWRLFDPDDISALAQRFLQP